MPTAKALSAIAAGCLISFTLYTFVAHHGDGPDPQSLFWTGYATFVLAGLLIFQAIPLALRQPALLVLTAVFAAVAFPPAMVWACLLHVGAMAVILRVFTRAPGMRLVVFVLWMAAFNVIVPHHVLGLRAALCSARGSQYVLATTLLKLSWRSVFCYYEVASGLVAEVELPALTTYLVGLPFLGGQTIALSYRHFVEASAQTRLDAEASLFRGLKTLAACGALMAILLVADSLTALFPGPVAAPGLGNVSAFTLRWFVQYYAWRVCTEQGTVAVCRLFGYNIRDDFSPTVLLSRNHMEFWRGWNALWREFMVAWIYYPLACRLGRRFGPQTPWVIALAGFATCLADVVFDFFPRLLFFAHELAPTMLRSCLYAVANHVVWGVLVGVNLYAYAARPARRRSMPWLVPIQIAFTVLTVVLLQAFKKDPALGQAIWSAIMSTCGCGGR